VRPGTASGYLSLDAQLDPYTPTARIPQPRAGSIPAWPDTLIEPTNSERVRWFQLWSSARAMAWVGTEHQRMVATLVRLEMRCRQPLPTEDHLTQLDHLRCELGLVEGA
jgi:hypothetical protein